MIVWRARAEHELCGQLDFIKARSPAAAKRMRDRIERCIGQLEQFPNCGRPSREAGTRELVIGGTPFIAVYLVRGDVVTILRFFHGYQKR